MMRMMGVGDFSIVGSWYITYGIYWIVVSAAAAFASGKLFPNSAAVVTFFIFLFFGLGTFSFCFFLSSFFWKARTAAIVGPVMYFMGFFLYYLIQAPDVGKPAALLLFPK